MSGKIEDAIALYKKAIEIRPNYARAHSNLAVAYYSGGQYDLAITHCDRAVELGYRVDPGFRKLLEPYRQDKT